MPDSEAPVFPPELERAIFEMAFDRSKPVSMPNRNLLLIAKRAYEWLRPLVYAVFNQCDRYGGASFPDFQRKRPYLTTPTIEDVGRFAKHLLFKNTLRFDSTEETIAFLRHCQNVESLAAWGDREDFKDLIPTLSNFKNLRFLSASLNDVPKDSLVQAPFCTTLTRLELVLPLPGFPFELLTSFPNLKQLSIFGGDITMRDDDTIKNILVLCPQLEVYGLTAIKKWTLSKNIYQWGSKEPRFVIFDGHMCGRESWLIGAHGGRNFWSMLEDIVLARKRESRWF
ncbi:hypothetical protein CVT24_008992 [Panaeolus cyanescens]|uniref:F-box domain-containing protein n=1 Tax=Panaeolus cyanescens TaxID=181874 RepID=A0A409YAS0_9AGAR|nr:hypothetical protein CVT24_008992 [Panaeolus cyanescens]